ncbi:MAG: cytochrome c nitrite reductase small subunit [Acidobacteriota bacterium]
MSDRIRFSWSWVVCVSIGVLLGTGLYTFYYAEGASYFSNDPRACANCHVMRDQYDSWQKASHHAVATCNDCHVPHAFIPKYLSKAKNGYFHSKGFTLMDFHEPIQIKLENAMVVQRNCRHCHESLVGEVAGHEESRREAVLCVRCHSAVGHGDRK